MANLKCKYCGGDVERNPDDALGVCGSCGEAQTMPLTSDPRKIAAHNAGNYFRRIGKFDKAAALYQKLLKEDPDDAEAAWGCCLCRYGVLYEQSDASGRYVPVSRTAPSGSILEDENFLCAVAHSEGSVKMQYQQEATRISQLLEPTIDVADRPPKDSDYLLRQAYLFLDQGKWSEADACCDKFLKYHHDSAMAWIAKLLVEVKQKKPKDLINCTRTFEYSPNYQNALRYSDPTLRKTLQTCLTQVKKRSRQRETEDLYQRACAAAKNATTKEQYQRAAAIFAKLSGYRDANMKYAECIRNAEVAEVDAIYLAAVSAASNARTIADYRKAVEMLERTRGWRDTDQRITQCIQRLEALESAAAERNEKAKQAAEKFKKHIGWKKVLAVMCVIAILAGVSGYLLYTRYLVPEGKYKAADALLAAGQREQAISAFQELADYKDAADRALTIQQEWYAEAQALLDQGDLYRAAASFGGLKDYADARERCLNLWDSIAVRTTLCAGGWYTVGLHTDGTVSAIGDNRDYQCEVETWQDITCIGAGWSHTVGLRSDGTVVAAGYNGDGRADVADWEGIVSLCAGQWHTVGLKLNGTVVAVGCENDGRIDLDDWKEVIAISAGRNHTVGLLANRTVVAAGDNTSGQCNLSGWTNILAVSAGGSHTLGLKEDGTVYATGSNEEGQCLVSRWENITSVAAGYYHSVGLRSDGTVVATGLNKDGQCNVSGWKDIVAIAAGGWHTVGLKKDGTIVSTGRNVTGQCGTGQWTDIRLPG